MAIGLLLFVPALAWGASQAPGDIDNAASGPTVTISGAGAPGQVVIIDGRGFKAHAVYQVHWDSVPRAIRLVWPSAKGTFHGHLRIPGTATEGTHTASFSRVDRAAAVKVKAGTLARSALVKTASVAHRQRAGQAQAARADGSAIDQPREGDECRRDDGPRHLAAR